MRFAAALAVLACCAVAASCGHSTARRDDGRLTVATTTSVLTDLTRNVAGDRVEVVGLVAPDRDPHEFEASPRELEALRRADLVVRNGAGFDRWLDPALRASGSHAVVIDASAAVTRRGSDPHIWLDPRNATAMVFEIAAAMSTADPEGKEAYMAHATEYAADIARLDAEIADEFARLSSRSFVTNHDAFGYFAARYGLDFVGSVIPTFESSAELSSHDVRTIVTAIKAAQVRAIFTENAVSAKFAETIAADTGVKVVGGDDALYGDGLGVPGSDGATYLAMMRHNARTIFENLR